MTETAVPIEDWFALEVRIPSRLMELRSRMPEMREPLVQRPSFPFRKESAQIIVAPELAEEFRDSLGLILGLGKTDKARDRNPRVRRNHDRIRAQGRIM